MTGRIGSAPILHVLHRLEVEIHDRHEVFVSLSPHVADRRVDADTALAHVEAVVDLKHGRMRTRKYVLGRAFGRIVALVDIVIVGSHEEAGRHPQRAHQLETAELAAPDILVLQDGRRPFHVPAHVDLVAEIAVVDRSRQVQSAAVVLGRQRNVMVALAAQPVVAPDDGGLTRNRNGEIHVHLLERGSPVTSGVVGPKREIAISVLGRELRSYAPAEMIVVIAPHADDETERPTAQNLVLYVERTGIHAFAVVVTGRVHVEPKLLVDPLYPRSQPVRAARVERPQQPGHVVGVTLFGDRDARQTVQIAEILVPDVGEVNLVALVGRVFHQRLDVIPAVGFVGPRLAVIRQRILVENAAVEIEPFLAEIASRKLEPELVGQLVVEPLAEVQVVPAADAQSPGIGSHADRRIGDGPPDDEHGHAGRRVHLRTRTVHLRPHDIQLPVMAHLVARADQSVGVARAIGHGGQRTELAQIDPERHVGIQVRQIELVAILARVPRRRVSRQRIAAVALVGRAVSQRSRDLVFTAGLFGYDIDDRPHRIRSVQDRRGTAHHLDARHDRKRKARIVDIAVGLSGDPLAVEQEKHVARIEPLKRQRRAVARLMELHAGQLPFERLLKRNGPAALDVAGSDDPGDDRRILQRQGRPRRRDHHLVHVDGQAVVGQCGHFDAAAAHSLRNPYRTHGQTKHELSHHLRDR